MEPAAPAVVPSMSAEEKAVAAAVAASSEKTVGFPRRPMLVLVFPLAAVGAVGAVGEDLALPPQMTGRRATA